VRILVVGAGAIGGYFGARLLAAGRDVTFLVRERRAEQLRRNGLLVMSPMGNVNLPTPPLVSAKEIKSFYGLILVSSKSYDLESSIEDFANAMGPNSRVLPLLNGMRHLDVLDARFGPRRVLGGLARISSTLDADGCIHQLGTFNALAFGCRDAGETAIDDVVEALRVPGFDALLSRDILHEMWEKWVFRRGSIEHQLYARHGRRYRGGRCAGYPGAVTARMRCDCRSERFPAARQCQECRSLDSHLAGFRLHRIDVAGYRAGQPY
jgi:2-dehydropantoate 2-reductase